MVFEVMDASDATTSPFIAVVGMAGRFPGAANVEEFWNNLVDEVESITTLSDDTLGTENFSTRGVLEGVDQFDASFFGYSPLEATLLDPQQRLFMECAWSAIESAGYTATKFAGSIGVYGGATESRHAQALMERRAALGAATAYQIRLGSGIDFLTTRTSYALGLDGPAVTVQTACSTSLVAVHVASQALLNGECDMALAGGVSAQVEHDYSDHGAAGLVARDGHCRTFDANADGTLPGNAVGIVVLRRLEDALADGDNIRAVIRGSAVNNDGRAKIGFMAPSVAGQRQAIMTAHAVADVDPTTIGYLEAHGTATPLGDPIEVEALTGAFGRGTRPARCLLGSVKTNIGHCDAAAGIAGFIKAAIAVETGTVPASLNFSAANPEIDFETSPFQVAAHTQEWPNIPGPRRAGVSSFGLGGTNAHVILEQPPQRAMEKGSEVSDNITLISAHSEMALIQATSDLTRHLDEHRDVSMSDVAFTSQESKSALPLRTFVVTSTTEETINELSHAPRRAKRASVLPPRVTFIFPGQGGQHLGMGAELYGSDPTFRAVVDEVSGIAASEADLDIVGLLYPPSSMPRNDAEARFRNLAISQLGIFAVQLAAAEMWKSWGVTPDAVAGHSLGSYAAACVAGVLDVRSAVRLVGKRSTLGASLSNGRMLAVQLPYKTVESFLQERPERSLAVAVVNGPDRCVVAGEQGEIEQFHQELSEKEVPCRVLRVAGAGHSSAVDAILPEFSALAHVIQNRAPKIPWISETTGKWLNEGDIVDPNFWVKHLREPVRFDLVLEELLQEDGVLLDMGPGIVATSLVRQHPDLAGRHTISATMPASQASTSSRTSAWRAAAELWQTGVPVEFQKVRGDHNGRRVQLPTYPFDRRRFPLPSLMPDEQSAVAGASEPTAPLLTPMEDLSGAVLTDTEATLMGFYKEALGVAPSSPQDSFFDLGGDSLAGTMLIRRINAFFGCDIVPRDFFRSPSISRLAELVSERQA